nr:MAG TPA: hypothetical protein [Herelleviridae sp.]
MYTSALLTIKLGIYPISPSKEELDAKRNQDDSNRL